jgi:hypothetical protein
MAVEVAIVALIGSGASIIEPNAHKSFSIMARKFSAGFFLAFFGGQDMAAAVQQFFNFEVSEGLMVFLTAYMGSAVLDRLGALIKAISIKSAWGKK